MGLTGLTQTLSVREAVNGTALGCHKNGRKSQVVERQVTHSLFLKPTLKDGFTLSF